MRIAQLAPPFERVPPVAYGGTERVVGVLTEELVRHGHEVTLFASGDSRTSAQLVPIVDRAVWRFAIACNYAPFWGDLLEKVVPQLQGFDVIHSHLGSWGLSLARSAPCPLVTTFHDYCDIEEVATQEDAPAGLPLVAVSEVERTFLPDANWAATVYSGIDLEAFTFNAKPGTYLVYLGRVTPEKGLDIAIRVALQARLPLKIAARPPAANSEDPVEQANRAYYVEQVRPFLEESSIELIGEVGDRDKDELLSRAAALLHPARGSDPYSLVVPEALACGTPVVAFRHGSVPEIIEHGTTGFLCDTEDELATAVGQLRALDRNACRLVAERCFSATTMARRYERVYEILLEHGPATLTDPSCSPLASAQLAA